MAFHSKRLLFVLTSKTIWLILTSEQILTFPLNVIVHNNVARPTRVAVRQTSPQVSYDGMGVKELRKMVKESKRYQRGVLSTLKKRKDLIQFLTSHNKTDDPHDDAFAASVASRLETMPSPLFSTKRYQSSAVSIVHKDNYDDIGGSDDRISNAGKSVTRIPRVVGMPPIPDDFSFQGQGNDDELSEMAKIRKKTMDKLFLTYPQLRELGEAANSAVVNTTVPHFTTNLPTNDNDNGQTNADLPEDDPEHFDDLSQEIDFRQEHHPMLRDSKDSDMDITFLGTASCIPSTTRGVSCTALRLNGRTQPGTWLFDAGESSQLQIQRSDLKLGRISKIFLTHAHGDHTFGLPGILCFLSKARSSNEPPIDIYGPEGTRMWIRVAMRYSFSRSVVPYRVHELMQVPMAPEWRKKRTNYHRRINFDDEDPSWGQPDSVYDLEGTWSQVHQSMPLEPNYLYGEAHGGRNIYPQYDHPKSADGAPVWELIDEDDIKVFAAPMSHKVPCVGFVVEEQSQPGRLKHEFVEPIVRRNLEGLKQAGFRVPMKAMAAVKNLPVGGSFEFPDGTVVTQEEAVEPPRVGRKIAICGDTSDARALGVLARDADLLIHEATNAFLPEWEKEEVDNPRAFDILTMRHGHATPFIAGRFARQINAKKLVMNHFSARYKGDKSVDGMVRMLQIENQAVRISRLNETTVAAAWDMMRIPIPKK